MDRLRTSLYWITVLLLLIALVTLYEYGARKKDEYQELLDYQNTKAIKDSIKMRSLIRQKEDALFIYRDSIRQQKIDYILLQNEKSQKQIRDVIRILPNSDTKFRDSLWTDEWARKDTVSY
jgi:CRISPR/Cas system CMR subunit Cmr4 (Cas7 group RAMP superfamily)